MIAPRLLVAVALTALSSCAGKSSPATGTGASGAGANGSGAGGSGGSSQQGGSGGYVETGAVHSVSGSDSGGRPPTIVCAEDQGEPDFRCPGEGIACGPLRGSIALTTSADALYVLDRGSGLVLRVSTNEAETERRVIDTGSVSVYAIAVAEPYVYWLSEKGVGRTKSEPSALPEPLAESCFPSTSTGLVTDATSVYWSAYSQPFQGAVLRVDNSAASPSAKASLLGALSSPVFAVDDEKLYFWSDDALSSLVKNERCSCTCSTPAPASALACETADGITPAPGSGGTPGYYENCGGQHVALNYRSDGDLIGGALADETHLYWYGKGSGTISRLPKNGPDLLDPLLESEPVPQVILPRPSDTPLTPSLFAFALDANFAYTYRRRNSLDGIPFSEELLRVAKDGSTVEQLHEQQLAATVQSMAVDATSVYVASVVSDGCTFEVRRFPK